MIKQSFLDSLSGLSTKAAERMVKVAGHTPYLVPEGVMAITLQARPNTVILWQEKGKVVTAEAGDGLELDNDI